MQQAQWRSQMIQRQREAQAAPGYGAASGTASPAPVLEESDDSSSSEPAWTGGNDDLCQG